MKVLVIGTGGREHAIADACYRSEKVEEVYVAPGNYGMSDVATVVNIAQDDHEKLINFAKAEEIDLTIVGPEAALAQGIVDDFQAAGLKIFGPNKLATQVESSKDFSKKIMAKYGIPTASYQTFQDYDSAAAYVNEQGAPIVIKEDGLKAGKGVTVAQTVEEALDALKIAFSIEGNKVVIEECLVGFEFSLMTFVHEGLVIPMEIAQDHKAAYDGDKGPNTGGMGTYSPVKKITKEIIDEAMTKVMKPMAQALVDEGVPFTGFLYGGLMLCKDGVKTIEFNARFGDPEAEVILPRLKSDFVDVIENVMEGKEVTLEWDKNVYLGVVLASENYPASSTKGALIEGVEDVDGQVFHMGTKFENDNYYTNGGRVMIIVKNAPTIEEAYDLAYAEVKKIKCDKLFYRNDIGKKDM
ncbi:MAG: phosphoribosylamine--glycine ligase [Firmicutes bacterium]|nr:phosphoribosylamine--glycine ligase [Bacillota bacterium]